MSEQKKAFPQGLVLGLTMAETAILIIFVLLLALTVLVGREADRRQEVERELEQYRKIHLILENRGISVEEILELIETEGSDRVDAGHWRELVRGLSGSVPEPSPKSIISQLNKARTELTRSDANENEKSAQDLEKLHRDGQLWRELVAKVGDDPEDEIQRLKSRIAELESKSGGTGTDHPSCWYDQDKTVAYLFDVALIDEGFILKPALAPQHTERRRSLPLEDVVTGTSINPRQFLIQTQPVFQWSVDNGCRFFVRAFDLTAPEKKELYKTRMRTLESRFYKNANPSGPPPFSDLVQQDLP